MELPNKPKRGHFEAPSRVSAQAPAQRYFVTRGKKSAATGTRKGENSHPPEWLSAQTLPNDEPLQGPAISTAKDT